MPTSLLSRVLVCLLVTAPGITLRITGARPDPVVDMLVFGSAIVAAAFLLAWAAEAARKDISGALAIALLALIAVLPEYAVDLYYAFRSGSDPSYEAYAAANMTGSNRLLLGFGWPLVVLVALLVSRREARARGTRAPHALPISPQGRLDVGFLAILAVVAFAIPALGRIPLWFGAALVVTFGLYLRRAGKVEDDEDEEFVGTAAVIADLPTRLRRAVVITLFVVAGAVILRVAEPFAESLVVAGASLGIDPYLLVQWLVPLASEAPEFIIAVMFALRGSGAAAIATLIAAKVNQWSLLVGSLPIAHLAGGGTTSLNVDARQVEEFVLTASQPVMGVALILALRFHWAAAAGLAVIFGAQFAVTDTSGRYLLSVLQVGIAVVMLVVHRRHILPTLRAPFARRPGLSPVAEYRTPVGARP